MSDRLRDAQECSRQEIAELRKRFREAIRGPVTLLTPLPRRMRWRLWATGHVDTAAIWLVDHGHIEAAVRLWRICGMW